MPRLGGCPSFMCLAKGGSLLLMRPTPKSFLYVPLGVLRLRTRLWGWSLLPRRWIRSWRCMPGEKHPWELWTNQTLSCESIDQFLMEPNLILSCTFLRTTSANTSFSRKRAWQWPATTLRSSRFEINLDSTTGSGPHPTHTIGGSSHTTLWSPKLKSMIILVEVAHASLILSESASFETSFFFWARRVPIAYIYRRCGASCVTMCKVLGEVFDEVLDNPIPCSLDKFTFIGMCSRLKSYQPPLLAIKNLIWPTFPWVSF